MVNRIVSLRNLPGAPEGNFEIVDMPIHNEDYESLLSTLHSALFEITGAFDDASGGDNDVLHGRIQSIGAKLSLITMDQAANTLLRSVELAIERLINEFYVPYIQKVTGEDYSDMPIVVDYSENTSQSIAELMSTLVSLGLEVSNETLLGMVPFISNVRMELKRIMNEQNIKLALQSKMAEIQQPAATNTNASNFDFDDSDPLEKEVVGTGSPNGGGKRVDHINKTQADR
jgi:hypothetical protein